MLQDAFAAPAPLTETSILPGLGLADLRPDLIARARENAPGGGEAGLSDEAFLLREGLARKDADGETGLLLPALLLFGRDDALRGALPGHGTRAWHRDARRRVTREDIRTNLLDTFDRLMAFAARYLPESAPGEGGPANLRDLVCAELFINSLLHRDYTKPFPAVFGIEPGRVYLENASQGPGRGKSKPRNPALARAFARLGWARGPGIASPLARWGRAYFGVEPMVFEGGTYRFIAAFPPQGAADMQVEPRKPPQRANPLRENPAAAAAASSSSLKARPSIRELEALLSEKLPDFPPPLEALAFAEPAWDEAPVPPAPHARPAFAVRWDEAGASEPERTAMRLPPTETSRPAERPRAPAPARETAPPPAASGERTERILKFCETPRHRAEIQEFAGFQNRDYFRKEILNPLIEQGLLAPTLPDKPNSPNQQYRTVRGASRAI
jgi:hypothetical protein